MLESKAAELHTVPIVVNYSLAGYKQPQQLMVLNYLLALGAEYDVVVNVDGFNEVSLPVAENIPSNLNPFFPRGWDRRISGFPGQNELRKIGLIEVNKQRREEAARFLLKTHLSFSPAASLVWRTYDRYLANEISRIQTDFAATKTASTFSSHGPHYTTTKEAEIFSDLAGMWKNSSMQMDALCRSRGIKYLHFLQPNQYVPDSKPMGPSEQKTAFTEGHPYQRGVLKGYPLLATAGEEMKLAGVDFTDLRNVFENVHEEVYIDNCCHVNGTGYDLVAQRIYAEMKKR